MARGGWAIGRVETIRAGPMGENAPWSGRQRQGGVLAVGASGVASPVVPRAPRHDHDGPGSGRRGMEDRSMDRTPSRSRAARTIGAAVAVTGLLTLVTSASGFAIDGTDCSELPDHAALGSALAAARGEANGGFDLDMWGTIVNRDGVVCAVAFTGGTAGTSGPAAASSRPRRPTPRTPSACPASRSRRPTSTPPSQPGGSLYGLQHSNPVEHIRRLRGHGHGLRHRQGPHGRVSASVA